MFSDLSCAPQCSDSAFSFFDSLGVRQISNRLAIGGNSSVILMFLRISVSQMEVGPLIKPWRKLDGFGGIGDGQVVLLLLVVTESPIAIGLFVDRIKFDSLCVIFDGSIPFFAIVTDPASRIIRFCIIGFESDRFAAIGYCLIELSFPFVCFRSLEVRYIVIGIGGDGSRTLCNDFVLRTDHWIIHCLSDRQWHNKETSIQYQKNCYPAFVQNSTSEAIKKSLYLNTATHPTDIPISQIDNDLVFVVGDKSAEVGESLVILVFIKVCLSLSEIGQASRHSGR